MNFNVKFWNIKTKGKLYKSSNELHNKTKYLKASILAILFGIVISMIVILCNGVNPFLFFWKSIEVSFGVFDKTRTLQFVTCFTVAALAIAIGFKTGIFNIGVSGQMLSAGSVALIIGILYGDQIANNGAATFGVILLCILTGALLAGIAGVLKAFFNIHEVVTTIMLNWTAWYFLKWAFTTHSSIYDSGQGTSIPVQDGVLSLAAGGNEWIIPFLIAILCVLGTVFLLSRTVLGHKLKCVGQSANCSKYAGIDVKNNIIYATLISGGMAGLAGFLYYTIGLQSSISFTSDTLPTMGFDAIAVTLVSYNNPFGILATSFLWGILKDGTFVASQMPETKISREMASLVFGIILYGAAISSLFIKFTPILWYNRKLKVKNNIKYEDDLQKLKQDSLALIQEKKEMYNTKKIELKEALSKAQNNKEKHELKVEFKEYIKTYEDKLKSYRNLREKIYNDVLDDSKKRGTYGIKNVYKNKINKIYGTTLDQIILLKNDYFHKVEELKLQKQSGKIEESKFKLKITDLKLKLNDEVMKIQQTADKNVEIKIKEKTTLMLSIKEKIKNADKDEIKKIQNIDVKELQKGLVV
ncbi:ABC transporter permease [Spiroplasma endosymbiont of Amphibalanus improvisus]|uniref:ABC transporter permease n=1 Tax=Spiroplasma endosymbiont of Amphibalanus improvisus TaxID=3066327 RepID=UPI00313F1212